MKRLLVGLAALLLISAAHAEVITVTPSGGGGGGTFPPTGCVTANGVIFNNATPCDSGFTYAGSGGGVAVVSGSFGLSGNISAAAWTTNGVRYKNVAATLTDTTSSGTVASAYTDIFGGNTIAASSATTYTNYATMFLSVPVVGTNVTFTNKWSLLTGGGVSIASGLAAGVQTTLLVNPASASGLLADFQVGGTSQWKVSAAGATTQLGGAAFGGALTGITTAALSGAATSTQSINATSTDGYVLTNTTAAANGAQQWSPRLRLTGQVWQTTAGASKTIDWIIENKPIQGSATTAGSELTFSSQLDGGGYTPTLVVSSLNTLANGFTTMWLSAAAPTANNYLFQNTASNVTMNVNAANGQFGLYFANNVLGFTVDASHNSIPNVVIGTAAIATNATDGFLHINSGAGAPTGTPSTYTGRVPIYIDTTNSQLWLYIGGAWKQPKTPAAAAVVTWQ